MWTIVVAVLVLAALKFAVDILDDPHPPSRKTLLAAAALIAGMWWSHWMASRAERARRGLPAGRHRAGGGRRD